MSFKPTLLDVFFGVAKYIVRVVGGNLLLGARQKMAEDFARLKAWRAQSGTEGRCLNRPDMHGECSVCLCPDYIVVTMCNQIF